MSSPILCNHPSPAKWYREYKHPSFLHESPSGLQHRDSDRASGCQGKPWSNSLGTPAAEPRAASCFPACLASDSIAAQHGAGLPVGLRGRGRVLWIPEIPVEARGFCSQWGRQSCDLVEVTGFWEASSQEDKNLNWLNSAALVHSCTLGKVSTVHG